MSIYHHLLKIRNVVNVKNKDNYCFLYAISSCEEHDKIKKDHERPQSYDRNEIENRKAMIEIIEIAFPIQIIPKPLEKKLKKFST